jgi:hypothetical protein
MKSLLLKLGFWRWMIKPLDFRFLVLFFVIFRFDEKETTWRQLIDGMWLQGRSSIFLWLFLLGFTLTSKWTFGNDHTMEEM